LVGQHSPLESATRLKHAIRPLGGYRSAHANLDTVYPSLGIGAPLRVRYPWAWRIPTARISPATPSTPPSTPSSDGRVLVTLKTVWRDGTSHLLFEPIEFMEKLAAIIPRPAVNLVLYYGVLAPHARWRSHGVRYGRPAPDVNAREREASPRAAGTPGAWTWAALMRRVFDLDVLACPRCGGRLRLIATVEDPAVVSKILAHLGLLHPTDSPGPAPPSADLRAAAPSHQ